MDQDFSSALAHIASRHDANACFEEPCRLVAVASNTRMRGSASDPPTMVDLA